MKILLFTIMLLAGLASLGQQHVDVKHYRFEIELSDKSDAITGIATITVNFPEPASEIQFDLAAIDQDKGMVAFQVMEGKQKLRTNHAGDVLTIYLDKPTQKGDTRTFVIQYMGTPKDGLIISKNKFGDRTFFADNWPDRAHNWIPCIDRPDDKASFEFLVKAPAQYMVISNGAIVSIKKDEGSGITEWHYKEDIPLSTKVMVIGVARFAVKDYADSPKDIPVSAWVYPQDSTQGFYDYGVAPSILQFFSTYIGPYPYNKLANVQSTTIFGGMENASAIFYAEQSVTGNRKWEDVLAHEIAHQWFGDMASEKSFAHLWLSEGFATYLTDIYIENKYGADSAVNRLRKERKDVIEFIRRSDHAVVDSTRNLMSLLNANSYQKGGWVLHMLRNEVGDSIFRNIIRQYYQQYKGSNAETRDFESVAEKESAKDLRWFFNQWLYRPGIPELEIQKKRESDGTQIKIIQHGPLYRFHLDLSFNSSSGKKTQRIWIESRETEIKFKVKGGADVQVDPDTKLLFNVH